MFLWFISGYQIGHFGGQDDSHMLPLWGLQNKQAKRDSFKPSSAASLRGQHHFKVSTFILKSWIRALNTPANKNKMRTCLNTANWVVYGNCLKYGGKVFYWTSHWEKWYEHYPFLSASAIPAFKWEDQEEVTISASKDFVCMWMGQEDTRINDLQDQSVWNTCICRKVLLIACSKKQHWITLPGSRLLFRVVNLLCFSPPSPQGKKLSALVPVLALAHLLLLFQADSAELSAALAIMKPHFSPLFILSPTGVPGSVWQAALPGYLWNREAVPRSKQSVWKLSTWITVWP